MSKCPVLKGTLVELVGMYRTETVERPYSKADAVELRRIGRKIKASKKDAGYRRAIDDLIKAST